MSQDKTQESTEQQPLQKVAENPKKSKHKNVKGKVINMVILVFVLIGLYWVVKSYFNVGNERYTNSAQVESFINPINTRVSAYINEIRFVDHQYVKNWLRHPGHYRNGNPRGPSRRCCGSHPCRGWRWPWCGR